MKILDKFLSNLLTHNWLTSLSTQLTDVLTRSGLLISEDITFIDTLIASQLDYDLNNDCLHSKAKYFNKQVLILLSLTPALVWIESSFTTYPIVFGSIISGISWKLSSLLYSFVYKIYSKHLLIQKLLDLSERLTKENNLIKKYYRLIEDNEVIDNSGKHSVRICEMKDQFRSICWTRFSGYRELTIRLRQTFPLNLEVDEELNYLCCFPIEMFDKFITEDKSVITLSTLKSLMQLRRLQQSELLRRIIYLFLTICLDKNLISKQKTIDNYIDSIRKEVLKIFESLIQDSDQTFPELLSLYNCGKSLWICTEKNLIKSGDRKQTNQTIETLNLLNINRSLRKHLFTALNILEECDSLIEEGSESTDFRFEVRRKLDSISTEFNSFNGLVINLEKLLRIEELKELKTKTLSSAKEVCNKESVEKSCSKFEDYVVRDQVFEAIVTEDCNQMDMDLNADDEELWEYRLKLAQESDASNNLFRELKVALKSKAVEHKAREAKALGIELDETEETDVSGDQTIDSGRAEQQLFDANTNEKTICDSNQLTNNLSELQTAFNETKVEKSENKLNLGLNSFGFQSQIACIAAEKGRIFGLTKQSEHFGDESESESESDQYDDQ